MRPKVLIIRKGSWIICPTCDRRLARVSVDLFGGDDILFSQFTDQTEQFFADAPNSPCCGTAWYDEGHLCTENGWLPEVSEMH